MRNAGLLVLCLVVTGCGETPFEERNALQERDALACVAVNQRYQPNCIGQSVVITGTVITDVPMGYLLSVEDPVGGKDPTDQEKFVAVYGENRVPLAGRVRIKGVIERSGFYDARAVVSIKHVAPITPAKPTPDRLTAQSDDRRTPEQRIADAREEGRRTLDEADAAIRANNDDLKNGLAAVAVAHHVRLSGDLRIDTYGMADGRWITCETVVYPTGAPITTCDGEP